MGRVKEWAMREGFFDRDPDEDDRQQMEWQQQERQAEEDRQDRIAEEAGEDEHYCRDHGSER